MKRLIAALLMGTAIVTPQIAQARPVQISVQMKQYPGPAAYAGIYLVKPDGSFHSDIAVAGQKDKYRAHLRGWFRGVSSTGRIDGVSGASIGSGRTLKVTAEISDALIKAGYKIQVDTAVEDYGESRVDASIDLKSAGSSASAAGRGFVQSLSVKM